MTMQVTIRPTAVMQGMSPSVGAMLGTTANSEVLQTINDRVGATYFGNAAARDDVFYRAIIAPQKQNHQTLENLSTAIMFPDKIVALTEFEHFQAVPPSMHMPILMYAPVFDMFKRGRIDGFGYDVESLPEKDIYDRLTNNGSVEDVESAMDPETGRVTFRWDMRSDDPELSHDDRLAIYDTRRFIDYLMEETDRDPTNIDLMRG